MTDTAWLGNPRMVVDPHLPEATGVVWVGPGWAVVTGLEEGLEPPAPLTVEPVQVDLFTAEDGAWLIRFATASATIVLDATQWAELQHAVAAWEDA